MTAALTRSSYVETFQFQPARELSECQWCPWFPAADCSTPP